jgi:hypothetical protein
MQNSIDKVQAFLQSIRWKAGRVIQQCDAIEAEFASLTQIAPEEAEVQAPRLLAQFKQSLPDLTSSDDS